MWRWLLQLSGKRRVVTVKTLSPSFLLAEILVPKVFLTQSLE